jgi:surface protein
MIGVSQISVAAYRGGGGAAPNPDFVSTWDTTKAGSASDTIILPLESGGTYSGTIDWGDGNSDPLSYANRTHIYASSGVYTITISGDTFEGWRVANSGDKLKFIDIQNWGFFTISSSDRQFDYCQNLNVTATDAPTITTNSFSSIFRNCDALTTPDFSAWDTSSVTNMEEAFSGCALFNGKVDNWVHSGVTSVFRMFISAVSFNQDLDSWDTSGVTVWYEFMRGASAFNSSMAGWEVHGSFNELTFGNMVNFTGIGLDTWDTSGMTSLRRGFDGCIAFNANIGSWDVSNVTNMYQTFNNCDAFDQDLSAWDINHQLLTTMLY